MKCAGRYTSMRRRYKEKLPSKCFQDHVTNKERFSDALNGQRWRFLKNGLDDFRNGCPPPSDNIIIRGKKGPVPVLLHYKQMDASQIVPYKARELQTKSEVSFSKLSAAQKARKDYIVQTEHCLTQHPLALYPHLEESVSPELFREVVRLLDPELHLSRSSHGYDRTQATLPTIQYHLKCETKSPPTHSAPLQSWLPKSKNPYTWFSKKRVAERERAARIGYVPPLDENVKRVTKEFCEWVSAMGGEKYNIDEATVMKLFDTRYESKSKTAAPIKIVELYHVPAELRECLGRPEIQETKSTVKMPSEPKWEKFKYGAWYLHPKKWKKQKASDWETVPEALKTFLELRKKAAKQMESKEKATPLHGTFAFNRFLEMRGYRKPAFLLPMLAAGNPDKVLEDTDLSSRKFSMQAVEEYGLQSSSLLDG
ncbi:protein FAM47E isoform X2 [Hemicordylus capensis]|uniref:protein FAM47E isoform X2 n=1 Tax=Hemicordylus capensis TaxID=884348 RepID=UPI002304261D|nr:protein FAM47E isoform X2 [Hemicordylus capensis]